jgi:Flp pilus assembly pilin Flp
MNLRLAARRCLNRLKGLAADDGIAITEYGLLIALICLALVAVVGVFGPAIASWFASRTGNITTV